MAKSLNAFEVKDYNNQKKFLSVLWNYLLENYQEIRVISKGATNPIIILQKMEAETTPKKSYAGLRIAVNDLLEMTKDFGSLEIEKIDKLLKSKKLPSLSQMRDKNNKKIRTLLINQEIKTDAEFYLVNNYINDTNETDFLDDQDRMFLNQMIMTYESQLK